MLRDSCFFRSIFLTALLMFSAAGCDGEKSAGRQPPSPEVGTYTVKSEPVTLTTELPGRTIACRVAEVRPQVNGIVQKRLFEEGSLVREGAGLYRIDSAVYRASYDKALARLQNTERTAGRLSTLKDRQSLSAQDYEDALYAWEQAKADAELARLNLEYCQVNAPLSGRIGRSNITEGALVTNGQAQALAVIQQIDPIYVDLTPAVSRILKADRRMETAGADSSFFQGAEVSLILEDGSPYPLTGRIKFLDNEVDQGTGSVALRAEFPNPDGKLLPGMFVRARVVESVRRDAALVPQQALTRDREGRALVWVVTDGGLAERREVTAERTVGNTWLVTAGLADGERVVTEGLGRLSPGLAVTPREAGNVNVQLAFDRDGAAGAAPETAQRAAALERGASAL